MGCGMAPKSVPLAVNKTPPKKASKAQAPPNSSRHKNKTPQPRKSKAESAGTALSGAESANDDASIDELCDHREITTSRHL